MCPNCHLEERPGKIKIDVLSLDINLANCCAKNSAKAFVLDGGAVYKVSNLGII